MKIKNVGGTAYDKICENWTSGLTGTLIPKVLDKLEYSLYTDLKDNVLAKIDIVRNMKRYITSKRRGAWD
jgi:hypothetical protein